MIIKLIIPIEALKGQLRKDGYYYRTWKGKQIVQRCPNRKGHVKTAAEAMNQERFIEKYRKKKSKGERLMAKGEGGRTTSALSRGAGNELKSGIECRANRQGQARIECGEINIHY